VFQIRPIVSARSSNTASTCQRLGQHQNIGAVQVDVDVVLFAAQVGHVDADEVAHVAEVLVVWHEVAVLGVFGEFGWWAGLVEYVK
jgi:hypothetical protein